MLRDLEWGDIGPDVTAMQEALNAKAPIGVPPIEVDGKFFQHTYNAVIAFQKLSGLYVDGVFGPNTRAALFPLVAYTVQVIGLKAPPRAPAAPPPSLGEPAPTFFSIPTLPEPLPTLASPPPPHFDLDNIQIQPGYQHVWKPWYRLNPASPANSSDTVFLTVQGVWLRSNDDRHLEITPGLTLQAPLNATIGDGSNWQLQYFIQFTAADMYWHYGRLHLASPFAQLSLQHGLSWPPANPTLGVGLYPINISVDLIRSKDGDPVLSVIGQAGLVSNYNLSTHELDVGPGAAVGLSVQIGAKKKK